MRRVVFIIDNIGDYHAARLQACADHLRADGIAVHAIEASDVSDLYLHKASHRAAQMPGVTVARGLGKGKPGFARRIRTQLAEIQPDVIFTVGYSDALALVSLGWGKAHGVPVYFMADSKADDQLRGRMTGLVKPHVIRRFEGAFVAGDRHRAYFRSLGLNGPVEIGYDVVDNDYFIARAARLRSRQAWLKRMGVLPDRYVLCVSRLVGRKRVSLALDIWSRSGAPEMGVAFVLIGAGPLDKAISAEIAAHPHRDLIHHRRSVRNTMMPAFYDHADALILASEYDQWGLCVNEAMALGTPAIVSRRCGVAGELVIDGINGHVFDDLDAARAAATLRALLVDPARRQSLGAAAAAHMRDWSLERFTAAVRRIVNHAAPAPTRGKQVVIVNAFGRTNRGDAVLLDECIAQVRIADPDSRITVGTFAGSDAPPPEAYTNVSLAERIGNVRQKRLGGAGQLLRMGVAWASTWPGMRWAERLIPFRQRKLLHAYRSADLVLSAPGGYIHDTNFAYLIALFHIALARRFGVAMVLAPQSIGPIASTPARWLTRKALGHAAMICTREGYSHHFVTHDLAMPVAQVVALGDSAFWNTDVTEDAAATDAFLGSLGLAPGEPFLGLTIVDWPFTGRADPEAERKRYATGMAEIIVRIHQDFGLRSVIFNQVSSDLPVVRQVAAMAGAAAIVHEGDAPPEPLRAAMGRARAFLGTRFHSCIFAMMAGRPTVAISYLPKTSFIMQDLGLDNYFSIAAFDAGGVYAKLASELSDLPAAEARISGALAAYRAKYPEFHTLLTGLFSGATND